MCLIDRVYKFNNTLLGFHYDLKSIAETLKCDLIAKVIRLYLNKVKIVFENKRHYMNIHYFKLQHIGIFCYIT